MAIFGFPEWVVIFLSAVFFSLLVAFINRKTGVKQRTDHMQKTMKDYQKEYNEALKADDKKRVEQLKAREPEVMKLMQDMMWLPFKNMLIVLPLFFLFMFVIQGNFPNFTQELPIALHLSGNELLGLNIFHSSSYGSRGFFILSSIVSGLVIEGIWGRYAKMKGK